MTEHRHNRVEPSAGDGQYHVGDSLVGLDREARQPDNASADHLERTLYQCSRPASYRMPRTERLAMVRGR